MDADLASHGLTLDGLLGVLMLVGGWFTKQGYDKWKVRQKDDNHFREDDRVSRANYVMLRLLLKKNKIANSFPVNPDDLV